MSVLRHLFLLASYSALAVAVALSLPHTTFALSLEACYGIAALIFLTGVTLHEGVARRWSDDDVRLQLNALAQAGRIRERDVADLARQISQFRSRLTTLADDEHALHKARAERAALNPHVEHLRDEIETAGDLAGKVLRAVPLPETATATATATSVVPLGARRAPLVAHNLGDNHRSPMGDGEVLALLREAVREDQIHVVSQPIVSLPQRKTCFRELFTRLRLPNGEALEAGRYVEIAEREGLITSIDNYQLFRSAQIARESLRRRRRESVFVNLSTHTLQDRTFVSRFVDFLSSNAELAGRVIFEFSIDDLDTVTGPLRRPLDYLAQRGFRYSMDGLRDLSTLDPRRLSEHYIRFVKMPADAFLSQADSELGSVDFNDMRAQLDAAALDLIVSHIESEKTLLRVLDHRVDYGQGHLFGEPG